MTALGKDSRYTMSEMITPSVIPAVCGGDPSETKPSEIPDLRSLDGFTKSTVAEDCGVPPGASAYYSFLLVTAP